jgi:predicted lipoprotein with Yx(FWY)xxD motif
MIRWLLPAVLVAAIGAGGAIAASAATGSSAASVKAVTNAKFGTILVAANGKTLYRYTKDSKLVNRCSSDKACAPYWPPLLVKATVKPVAGAGVKSSLLGTIKAKSGMRQVTYAGFPLYYFSGDKAAGQLNGQGFESEWYVVNGTGAFVKHAVATSTGGTSTTPTSTDPGYNWG